MPAIFLNIPWYVETLDSMSANFLLEVVEVVEVVEVGEVVVERYQEQPVSCLLV